MSSTLKRAARAVATHPWRQSPLTVRGRLDQQARELKAMRRELERLKGSNGAPPKKGDKRVKITDMDFHVLKGPVREAGRTLLGDDRLWVLFQAARNTAPLGLPGAEVGAYRGGSSFFLAATFKKLAGRELPFHVVDTFEGHPEGQLTDKDDPRHVAGLFSKTSYDEVVAYLAPFEQTQVHKGAFENVVDELPQGQYGFAHIDVDVYGPMMQCLRFFAPRIPRGGVMILDDYGAGKCPGVKQAADEFLAETEGWMPWHPHTEQLVLVHVG